MMNETNDVHDVQLAAYYFPNWHPSLRNDHVYGPGESEWKVVRAARPRFAGHQQPRTPLWGYEDESQPAVMARKIAAAAEHGIAAFLFDWYWNDEGPFLQAALEQGFLDAPNRDRLKFALMWANHQPVTRQTFDRAIAHSVDAYFSQPAYWRVEGKLYLSIYEMHTLIAGLGSIDATRHALDALRERVAAAGLPGLHLNAVEWGLQRLPAEYQTRRNAFVADMGIDSVTSYVWVHNPVTPDFPTNDYAEVAPRVYDYWRRFAGEFSVPYHPNVTMGWDSWPRVPSSEPFAPGDYPRTPLITGNTPQRFGVALQEARRFVQALPPSQRIITLNAWNEWTEGSYLEPDMDSGMGYLNACRL
jgi:hypothetical protein